MKKQIIWLPLLALIGLLLGQKLLAASCNLQAGQACDTKTKVAAVAKPKSYEGRLLKDATGKIWLVKNSQRLHIKTAKELAAYKGQAIIKVDAKVLAGYPEKKSPVSATPAAAKLTVAQALEKARSFIANNLINEGQALELKVAGNTGGAYQLEVKVDGQSVKTAISEDGKYFYPNVMLITEVEAQVKAEKAKQQQEAAQQPTATPLVKSDKPLVELFVMSHCPFGTQIEKGLLPVLETLGTKIDFRLKFVDYAMHGETELKEQINQHCIATEQPMLLTAYLQCFLAAGDGQGCVETAKIDKARLQSCYEATDKQYSIMETYAKGQSAWGASYPPFAVYAKENQQYQVQGSPTLVINGVQVETGRSPSALLMKICSAFNQAPDACNTKLDGSTPAAGFGFGQTAQDGAAACGN